MRYEKAGRVLGHTASGKPIYEHAGHNDKQTQERYAGWSLADHKEASARFGAKANTAPEPHFGTMQKFHFEMMMHATHPKGSDAATYGSAESARAGKYAKTASKQFTQYMKDNAPEEPRNNPSLKPHSISTQAARLLAGDIGLKGLRPDELEAFRRGLEIEHEHFGSVNGSWNKIAKITADHLDEDPDYYTKLDYWEAYASEVDLEDL